MKQECPFCGILWKEIRQNDEKWGQKYKGRKILQHLLNHEMTFDHAIRFITGQKPPFCECGCGRRVKPSIMGKIKFPRFIRFHKAWNSGLTKDKNEKILKISESMSGSKNPMYGKKPWNRGLTKETNKKILNMSKKRIGSIMSEESKLKMSESAKKRTIHGHTGYFHSKETIEFFRRNTAKMISDGVLNKDSVCEDEFAVFLEELGIHFIRQKYVEYFSFDFYLVDLNVYIEIDGDWLHCNKINASTKMQKRVIEHDKIKNKYCKEHGMKLIRIWNSKVTFEEVKKCITQLESGR